MGIQYTTHMNRGKKRWRYQWKTGPEDKPKTSFTSTANRATEEGAAEMWAATEAEIVEASSLYQDLKAAYHELHTENRGFCERRDQLGEQVKTLEDTNATLDANNSRLTKDYIRVKENLDAKTQENLGLATDIDIEKQRAQAEAAQLNARIDELVESRGKIADELATTKGTLNKTLGRRLQRFFRHLG